MKRLSARLSCTLLFAVCALAILAPSRSWAEDPNCSEVLNYNESKDPERVATIEDGVSRLQPQLGSIESLLPADAKVLPKLYQLQRRYLDEHGLRSIGAFYARRTQGGARAGMTREEIINGIFSERDAMAEKVRTLSKAYFPVSARLNQFLNHAAGMIETTDLTRKNFREKSVDFRGAIYSPADAELLAAYLGRIKDVLGGLIVGVQIANVQGVGIRVGWLDRYWRQSWPATRVLLGIMNGKPERQQNEINIISQNATVWGEIKSYDEVYTSTSSGWKKLRKQLESMANLARALLLNPTTRETLGGRIRLKIYFLAGVSDVAAREIQAMGYEVIDGRPAE